ncbi:MAG: hypothetical protein FWG55_01750 [Candidatus Bathyarchaeota archaeon]|nr:hypothetical protein [Candidatus Termiticorpusculum sp.]
MIPPKLLVQTKAQTHDAEQDNLILGNNIGLRGSEEKLVLSLTLYKWLT